VDDFWRQVQGWASEHAGRAVGSAAILAVGVLALRYLVAPLRRLLERGRVEPSTASFLTNSLRTLLLVAVVLGVLQQLGVQTVSLLTLLGAAGLAVALSLQNTLANFTAGLLVLSFRIVRVGDFIEVGDLRGRVSDLLPFHVVLVTPDNQAVTLPNTMLTGGGVRNHSALPTRRVQWLLPLPPQADLNAAKEVLLGRLRADPRVLPDPSPQVFVQEWGADKRVLAVQAWTATADSPGVQQDLLEALGTSLEGLQARTRRPG
jgi:small conductance mechanosensitive channel